MSKRNQIKANSLSSLISFILGHRPDEFGLVPDAEGYISYKDLLWAIHEEPGWGYVRQSHINEVLIGKDRSLFEWDDHRVRVMERRWSLDIAVPCVTLPKILYACVRRRAHAYVMERGLRSEGYLVLSPDRDMALRIGRRKDQDPVVLEIMTEPAKEKGIAFYSFGQLILTLEIPAGFISGPPVAADIRKETQAKHSERERPVLPQADFLAGTFILDTHRDPDRSRRQKGRKRLGWKEESRRLRKDKR